MHKNASWMRVFSLVPAVPSSHRELQESELLPIETALSIFQRWVIEHLPQKHATINKLTQLAQQKDKAYSFNVLVDTQKGAKHHLVDELEGRASEAAIIISEEIMKRSPAHDITRAVVRLMLRSLCHHDAPLAVNVDVERRQINMPPEFLEKCQQSAQEKLLSLVATDVKTIESPITNHAGSGERLSQTDAESVAKQLIHDTVIAALKALPPCASAITQAASTLALASERHHNSPTTAEKADTNLTTFTIAALWLAIVLIHLVREQCSSRGFGR